MRKWIIAGAAALVALAGVAIAQTLSPLDINGQSTWVINYGGSGSGVYITLDQARNSRSHTLVGTGTAITTSPTNAIGTLIATGTATTWAITLPNPAIRSETFIVANGTGSTLTSLVTVTAGTTPQNQTLAQSYSSQSISAGASAQWDFDYDTLTWYRTR